jgi:TatD family-associated radical SAM protein
MVMPGGPQQPGHAQERCAAALMLYELEDRLYVNLTNRCPVACAFCVKKAWKMQFRGQDLSLEKEPELGELLPALERRLAQARPRELVFCGFGECTYRLDLVSAIGLNLRLHRNHVRVRLDTIGLGSLIWGRDISRQLALCLDSVSVSLNTADAAQWEELHRPAPAFRGGGFRAAKEFVARCVAAGLETRVTAVEQPGVDLGAVAALARRLGAGFAARPLLA